MKLDCRPSVLKFLRQLAECAPHNLKKEEPQYDYTMLSVWLGKDLASDLRSALNKIRIELVPRHAEDNSLMNAFWEQLVCEVDANPQDYLDTPQALADLVDKFGEALKKPLYEFEVICSIENLEIGENPITIIGVEFFSPTDLTVAKRILPKSDFARWLKKEGSRTLSIVVVEAASGDTAVNVARDRVARALRLLQVSALCGVPRSTLFDDLYLWKLSGFFLSRPIAAENSQVWHKGFRRQFGPAIFNLGNDIREGIRKLKLELLFDLPDDIRDRVLRSFYWISHSVIHEADDHKIVDLCTAMEILLIPEEFKGSKGTIIALRYKLLGGSLNASSVKWLYTLRNEVVHGGQLPVIGPRDIWELRLVCYATIESILLASVKRPGQLTLRDLIESFETEENLSYFIKYAPMGVCKDPMLTEVIKEAKKRQKKKKVSTDSSKKTDICHS